MRRGPTETEALGTRRQVWCLQPGQQGEAAAARQALSSGIGIEGDGKKCWVLPSPTATTRLRLPGDWVGLSCRVSFSRGKEGMGVF